VVADPVRNGYRFCSRGTLLAVLRFPTLFSSARWLAYRNGRRSREKVVKLPTRGLFRIPPRVQDTASQYLLDCTILLCSRQAFPSLLSGVCLRDRLGLAYRFLVQFPGMDRLLTSFSCQTSAHLSFCFVEGFLCVGSGK